MWDSERVVPDSIERLATGETWGMLRRQQVPRRVEVHGLGAGLPPQAKPEGLLARRKSGG